MTFGAFGAPGGHFELREFHFERFEAIWALHSAPILKTHDFFFKSTFFWLISDFPLWKWQPMAPRKDETNVRNQNVPEKFQNLPQINFERVEAHSGHPGRAQKFLEKKKGFLKNSQNFPQNDFEVPNDIEML